MSNASSLLKERELTTFLITFKSGLLRVEERWDKRAKYPGRST